MVPRGRRTEERAECDGRHAGLADCAAMRVLVCPDKFAGTLSALQAAAAVVAGWRSVAPADELVVRPLSDGGPGFLDVIEERLSG